MIDTSRLPLFVMATLVLLITPGPAILYITARSLSQGRTAGIVSVLGLELGTVCHVLSASFGLSALLLSSALAFAAAKYLGAAYLIYLGVRKLLSREELQGGLQSELQQDRKIQRESLRRVFWQGFIVNLLNPKTALFLFAFLPQFVDTGRGSATTQMLLLGLLFVALATLSDGAYALLSGSVGNWLRNNTPFVKSMRHFAGGIYIGLGVLTALSGSRSK